MCGIAGQYCLDGAAPDSRLLAEMSERLTHRGPDSEGAGFTGLSDSSTGDLRSSTSLKMAASR